MRKLECFAKQKLSDASNREARVSKLLGKHIRFSAFPYIQYLAMVGSQILFVYLFRPFHVFQESYETLFREALWEKTIHRNFECIETKTHIINESFQCFCFWESANICFSQIVVKIEFLSPNILPKLQKKLALMRIQLSSKPRNPTLVVPPPHLTIFRYLVHFQRIEEYIL